MSFQTSLESSRAPTPPTKGKLNLKITQARDLRTTRDSYVIATFQHNVLVSKGPLLEDQNDVENSMISPGIPITTAGNGPGLPMAIPMKSQQSFNDSPWVYWNAKAKGCRLSTNPKWDTEVIL
jgi:protein-serine/threonine kinase